MHILFLSHYFPPEVNAPASRTFDHALRWVKDPNVKVTVITNHPNHPYGILYPGHKNQWVTWEKKEGIDVCRVKTYLAPNSGFTRRIINYLFFMFASITAAIWVRGPDVVVATSPQFFCAVAGYITSRIKKRPFIFELRDIWPESIVTVGAMGPSLSIRLLEKLELFLYRKSTKVIALTDAFKENLIKRGISSKKIEVIKNGVDLSFFSPRPRPFHLIQKINADRKFVISYIGTIGMAHAVDKIIDVAERMQNMSEILFLVLGEGAAKRRVIELISRKALRNVQVLPGVTKEEVRDYYAVTDLNLITLRNTPLFRAVIPSKIFEIMAMARPILCAVDGETRELIEQAKSGIFVEPENVDQMVETIEKLWQNRKELTRLGRNGRQFVESSFDRDKLARTYLGLLRETAGSSS